ncbi:efflux RND transporter permease subunit [Sulfurimonas lithotrophica]|uniref:Efflux RND transporter permease subunit n=1 Tax=Sulfurimonas lithotrophica TaxID=2590022 RepID=A0A5P8P084_9BACT|nr:efflux RND transporter permease subunit [Sulfurimonas lithotrophica]QFR49125.1 efflux RND transporter permease subunit [Sulfurimonas lithotrophica]
MGHEHQGKKFEEFVYGILDNPKKTLIVFGLVALFFVGSIMMFPTKIVLAKMLPGKSTNTFTVYIDTPNGSSIDQTKAVSECTVGILQKEEHVTDLELFLGQGSPLDYAGLVKGSGMKIGEQFAEIVVNLTDKHTRDDKSFNMVQRLRPVIKDKCIPLVEGTNIKMIEMPAGPPTLASIVVEVYGKDNQKVIELSRDVASILKNTEGLVDVDVMADESYKKYQLVPISDKISKSGLSVEQVNQILYLAFEGMGVAVKNTIDLNDQISIFVSLSDESQKINSNTISSLKAKLSQLSLMNKNGMMIPLTEVVAIEEGQSSPMIYHKNLKTMVNVVAETDMVSQVYPLLEARDIMIEKFSDKYKVSKVDGITTYMFDLKLKDKTDGEEYLLRWDGEMKVTLDTFRDLGAAFIAALILIFLLLVVYYKSFALSGIVLGGSFLSIIGVIIGHWVADLVTTETFFLTATSLIGFIALMGISSRNSLLLIDFAKSLIEEKAIEKRRAIAIASATRAKPIMLTAIAIILGSALLASDPVFGGLGVALISGTVAAVIVSLIFIPILMDKTKDI